MIRFEYKILPALDGNDDRGGTFLAGASQGAGRQDRSDARADGGWEFVGRKEVPVERRRWLILRQSTSEEYLIYRRAIDGPERIVQRAPEDAPAPAIRPRRVLRDCFPDLGLSDSGARRTRLRTPQV